MLHPVRYMYGTDPEGFLFRGGKVIGSERVLPEAGLTRDYGGKALVVRDGIQFELNPGVAPTIAGLGLLISESFRMLKERLRGYPEVSISFNGVVEVEREELDGLGEKSRILGCMPSKNIYGLPPIDVNPLTYRMRSAGGHLHFGLRNYVPQIFDYYTDERQRLVALLDIFVGNIGVLLDRDPGAIERRKNYGRVGEFRLPDHGIEYRTLSNFWLRNFSLMDLMFGMGHVAVSTLNQSLGGGAGLDDELVEAVNIKKFIDAIQGNDWDLAMENFNTIRPFLAKHLPQTGYPLNHKTLDKFVVFAQGVKAKGLEAYFPQDPVEHWIKGEFVDFPTFLERTF